MASCSAPLAAVTVALTDAAGTTVRSVTSASGSIALNEAVAAGRYTIAASAAEPATVALAGSYPPRPAKMVIGYDTHDHATRIDDGTVTVTDTLAPSGRVLRHRVVDDATGDVVEDTLFGYGDRSDRPAYGSTTG